MRLKSLLVVVTFVLLGMVVPGSSSGQTIPRDSATGTGLTQPSGPGGASFIFAFDASISVFGGVPTGTASVEFVGIFGTLAGDVRCLSIEANGTQAVMAVDNSRGSLPSGGFRLLATDGGPEGSGLDKLALRPTDGVPRECDGTNLIEQTVSSGDIVVRDVAPPPAFMVGEGTVELSGFLDPSVRTTATYSYSIDCDATQPGSTLEIRLDDGRQFVLTDVDHTFCFDQTDQPNLAVGFNNMQGSGTGTLDGTPGYQVSWEFIDGGPGGANDGVGLSISDPTGFPLLGGSAQPPGGSGSNTAQLGSATPALPTTNGQCKNGGWRNYGTNFKNQGQCVAFVQRGPKH
jgi:hypothetical protein